MTGWVFLGAPADSVLRGGGAELAPARLRDLDLPGRLGARDAGDVPVAVRGDRRDPSTGLIASEAIVANASDVLRAVASLTADGEHVLVSGGCCAIAPSAIAAVARPGRTSVVYVDGHQDLWDGETSPTGEAADMPLGVVIGLGPAAWVDAVGGAAASPDHVFLVGNRDDDEASTAGLPSPAALGIHHVPIADVRAAGPAATGSSVAASAASGGEVWLHLDVDVVDPAEFPATDYLDPGGLSWDELAALLEPLGRLDALRGVSLGCFNPEKDADGTCGERLVDLLVEIVGPAGAR